MTLYSTGCPKCRVLEKKLEILGKEFTLITDSTKLREFADEHNIHTAPILVVDDKIMDFKEAIKYLS